MNHNTPPPDDLPNHLFAASTLITYRQRTRTRTLRRLAILIIILAGLLLTYHFANAAGQLPPRPTQPKWPPAPPSRYYCQPANPQPPSYCYRPNSHPPTRRP